MDRIDEIDAQILTLLQESGRIKRTRIAKHVGLSLPSVSERMRKLHERGVLLSYHAVVDPARLRYDITAFIRVRVEQSVQYAAFTEQTKTLPQIQEVHSITGEGSHILKVRTYNTTTLERLLAQIQAWPSVRSTTTSVVLSTFKETRALPVTPTVLYNHD